MIVLEDTNEIDDYMNAQAFLFPYNFFTIIKQMNYEQNETKENR